MGEFVANSHEQRLEPELRREVELLETSPGRAHCLRSPLCACKTLARGVFTELRQLVEVDRGRVGADRDGDEVGVPGTELLELREQLLALGAARRPLHTLLRLACGEVELGDPRLFQVACLACARMRVLEQRTGGVR